MKYKNELLKLLEKELFRDVPPCYDMLWHVTTWSYVATLRHEDMLRHGNMLWHVTTCYAMKICYDMLRHVMTYRYVTPWKYFMPRRRVATRRNITPWRYVTPCFYMTMKIKKWANRLQGFLFHFLIFSSFQTNCDLPLCMRWLVVISVAAMMRDVSPVEKVDLG